MRKLIGLLVSGGMLFASLYIFYAGIFLGRGIGPGLYWAAGIFGFVGAGWLWADYLSPLLGFGERDF